MGIGKRGAGRVANVRERMVWVRLPPSTLETLVKLEALKRLEAEKEEDLGGPEVEESKEIESDGYLDVLPRFRSFVKQSQKSRAITKTEKMLRKFMNYVVYG